MGKEREKKRPRELTDRGSRAGSSSIRYGIRCGDVYSRAQKTWLNSIVWVGGEGEGEVGRGGRRVEKGRGAASRGWRRRKRRETRARARSRAEKRGGRRQRSLVSRLIPLPLFHLIALSHATNGCVGVSGRLKKHGRLRPSISRRTGRKG